MIRMLSLAAALAVLPLSAAYAGTSAAEDAETPSEAAIEAAATAFEARMQMFGARAEAIQDDKTLTDAQRETRVAALWSEYQPEVAVFTAAISEHAGKIAQEALADIDIDALVEDAMASPDVQAALTGAKGIAANGAWAQNDPEQQVTYGPDGPVRPGPGHGRHGRRRRGRRRHARGGRTPGNGRGRRDPLSHPRRG